MSWLWMLLPDELLPLFIVGIGLAVILRILRVKAAMAILGGLLLSFILSPFVDAIFDYLPAWVSVLVILCIGLVILRGLISLLIGRRAAEHMVGSLAAELVKGIFSLLLLPFKIIGMLLRHRER
jgi:hypothetical protein